jgi:DNA repair exonuclease SbcCD ATPase subunit
VERKDNLTPQTSQNKQPLRDLFDQLKKELEGAKRDLDAARQQTETQRIWIEKERDQAAALVSDLSRKRLEFMQAVENVKKDQEATEILRKQMGEAAVEAGRATDTMVKEFESAMGALAERRRELSVTFERIRDISKELDSKRSRLVDLANQIRQTSLSKSQTPATSQCPSCGKSLGPKELFCDKCGTPVL